MAAFHAPVDRADVSFRRNCHQASNRKDGLMEWMKQMLYHSFVLDARDSYQGTMKFFEELVDEHMRITAENKVSESSIKSRLEVHVPSVGIFYTPLPMSAAFQVYDTKYFISKRRFITPSINEIRHVLNLAQVMAIGPNLELITFDGDQTLYSDGGNFENNDELAIGIMSLLCHGVKVAVVTAAGYGNDGSKYAKRLRGLLERFIAEDLTQQQIENMYVFGGECNYLLQCTVEMSVSRENAGGIPGESRTAVIRPVHFSLWQAEHLSGPKPAFWPLEQVETILDVAERSMRATVSELHLRVKVLRKERAVGVYPGGAEMAGSVPVGHGSLKIKREALDELVLRVVEELQTHEPRITLPYCVFNGGTDAWLDVGNKSVGVAVLQAYLKVPPANCLHVGDQFSNTGNDIAARETCPCIWIINPRETGKVLQHVVKYGGINLLQSINISQRSRRPTEDITDIAAGVVPGQLKASTSASRSNSSTEL
ncbi:IMP-specific 5-nucleotidase [Ochromonadaceae sp. CCMP2298]|nr:IMP-specific 5-nucleotidase [Ochromonadaceae sp. CCMP2298]